MPAPAGHRQGGTPPTLDEVAAAARAVLEPHEAGWLVGGCVRDELLGRRLRDVDLVVDGDAGRVARRLADRLGGSAYQSSDRFGTWRVVLPRLRVDVAPLRADEGPAPATRGSRVARLLADLRARDVTVNALARPPAACASARRPPSTTTPCA